MEKKVPATQAVSRDVRVAAGTTQLFLLSVPVFFYLADEDMVIYGFGDIVCETVRQ